MESKYEDKYLLKYSALEHDFEELQEEAEEVTNQLQRAKEAKRLLQAEVRFLRRRAMLLRERANSKPERIMDPYFMNDAGGEASSQSGYHTIPHVPSRKMTSGTKPGKADNRSVVASGTAKTSSKQPTDIDNYPPIKRKGSNKRKISWKDDYLIQV